MHLTWHMIKKDIRRFWPMSLFLAVMVALETWCGARLLTQHNHDRRQRHEDHCEKGEFGAHQHLRRDGPAAPEGVGTSGIVVLNGPADDDDRESDEQRQGKHLHVIAP